MRQLREGRRELLGRGNRQLRRWIAGPLLFAFYAIRNDRADQYADNKSHDHEERREQAICFKSLQKAARRTRLHLFSSELHTNIDYT